MVSNSCQLITFSMAIVTSGFSGSSMGKRFFDSVSSVSGDIILIRAILVSSS